MKPLCIFINDDAVVRGVFVDERGFNQDFAVRLRKNIQDELVLESIGAGDLILKPRAANSVVIEFE